jgi:hypothetical protein
MPRLAVIGATGQIGRPLRFPDLEAALPELMGRDLMTGGAGR